MVRETTPLFSAPTTFVRLRQTLIGNVLLGIRVTDASLANAFGVHRQTVAEHAAKIEAALLGSHRQTGEFDRAFGRIVTLLQEARIVTRAT